MQYLYARLFKIQDYVWRFKTAELLNIIQPNSIIQSKTNGTNGWNLQIKIDNDEFVIIIKNINWPLLLAQVYKLNIEMQVKINDHPWTSAKTMNYYYYDGYNSWSTTFSTGLYINSIKNYDKKKIVLNININIKNIYDENGNEIQEYDWKRIGFHDNKQKCIYTLYGGTVMN